MLGALLLITLGILFLLNNLYPARFQFSEMWPVILIVIGLVKIVEYFERSARSRKPPVGSPLPTSSDRSSEASDGKEERP